MHFLLHFLCTFFIKTRGVPSAIQVPDRNLDERMEAHPRQEIEKPPSLQKICRGERRNAHELEAQRRKALDGIANRLKRILGAIEPVDLDLV